MARFASVLSLPGRSKRWESAPVAEEADAAPATATTTQQTATSSLWRSTNREIEAMPMRRRPFLEVWGRGVARPRHRQAAAGLFGSRSLRAPRERLGQDLVGRDPCSWG